MILRQEGTRRLLVWYLDFDQYGTSTFPIMYGLIAYTEMKP